MKFPQIGDIVKVKADGTTMCVIGVDGGQIRTCFYYTFHATDVEVVPEPRPATQKAVYDGNSRVGSDSVPGV